MALTAEQWFPNVIWSGLLSNVNNTAIEDFAYERKEQDEGVKISNYIGCCAAQVQLPELQIQNIWININSPGAYNHLHNHAGSILSGVYYVNSTPEQGNIFFERSDNAEYFLPPVEKPNYFTSTATTYKATTGALYVFPGWMKHSVQPNTTDKDRISVSFNYGVNNANRT